MNSTIISALVISLAVAPAFAVAPKTAAPASGDSFKSDDERTAYAYGYKIGQNLSQLGLSDAEVKSLTQGLRAAASGKSSEVNMAVYLPKVQQLIEAHVQAQQAHSQAQAGPEKQKGKAFSDKFAKEDGVGELTGGGWIKTLTPGTGATPAMSDTVKVHYRGTLIDGTEFDSSYKRGEPATFPLNGVIPCWTNGVSKMKVGGKAKLVCPSDVAYGDQGHPPTIPGGATLVFEVELLEVVKADAPAPKMDAKPAAKK